MGIDLDAHPLAGSLVTETWQAAATTVVTLSIGNHYQEVSTADPRPIPTATPICPAASSTPPPTLTPSVPEPPSGVAACV